MLYVSTGAALCSTANVLYFDAGLRLITAALSANIGGVTSWSRAPGASAAPQPPRAVQGPGSLAGAAAPNTGKRSASTASIMEDPMFTRGTDSVGAARIKIQELAALSARQFMQLLHADVADPMGSIWTSPSNRDRIEGVLIMSSIAARARRHRTDNISRTGSTSGPSVMSWLGDEGGATPSPADSAASPFLPSSMGSGVRGGVRDAGVPRSAATSSDSDSANYAHPMAGASTIGWAGNRAQRLETLHMTTLPLMVSSSVVSRLELAMLIALSYFAVWYPSQSRFPLLSSPSD